MHVGDAVKSLGSAYLQERFHNIITSSSHRREVGSQHAVDQVSVHVFAHPHAHGLLEHPCAAEARVV